MVDNKQAEKWFLKTSCKNSNCSNQIIFTVSTVDTKYKPYCEGCRKSYKYYSLVIADIETAENEFQVIM